MPMSYVPWKHRTSGHCQRCGQTGETLVIPRKFASYSKLCARCFRAAFPGETAELLAALCAVSTGSPPQTTPDNDHPGPSGYPTDNAHA